MLLSRFLGRRARRRSDRPLSPLSHVQQLEDRWMLTAGFLDPMFGTGGVSQPRTSDGEFFIIRDVVLQSDGKIVVVGNAGSLATGNNTSAVERLNADGTLDTSFNGIGKRSIFFDGPGRGAGSAYAVALQSDGKIVVVGESKRLVSGSLQDFDFGIVRLNSDGTLDSSFGTGGQVVTDFGTAVPGGESYNDVAFSVVIDSDGSIVVAGQGGPNLDWAMARYSSSGELSNQWTTDWGGQNRADDVRIRPDGKILVSGIPNSAFGFGDGIAQYNRDGTPDDGSAADSTPGDQFGSQNGRVDFYLNGVFRPEKVRIALGLDDTILLASTQPATVPGDNTQFVLRRYDANGNRDPSFGVSGPVVSAFTSNASLSDVAIQSDGRIVLVGNQVDSATLSSKFAMMRFHSDGMADLGFGTGGMLVTDQGRNDRATAAALRGNSLIIAGARNNAQALARYSLTNGFTIDLTSNVPQHSPDNPIVFTATAMRFGRPVTTNVRFEVRRAETSELVFTDSGNTDFVFGKVEFSYTAQAAGLYAVTVSGAIDGEPFSKTLEIRWAESRQLQLALLNPHLEGSTVAATFLNQTVVATLTRQIGLQMVPVADETVIFKNTSYTLANTEDDREDNDTEELIGSQDVLTTRTNSAGQAFLTFSRTSEAKDRIEARAVVDQDSYFNTLDVYWVGGTPALTLDVASDDGTVTVTAVLRRDLGLPMTRATTPSGESYFIDPNPVAADVPLTFRVISGANRMDESTVEVTSFTEGKAVFTYVDQQSSGDLDTIRVSGSLLTGFRRTPAGDVEQVVEPIEHERTRAGSDQIGFFLGVISGISINPVRTGSNLFVTRAIGLGLLVEAIRTPFGTGGTRYIFDFIEGDRAGSSREAAEGIGTRNSARVFVESDHPNREVIRVSVASVPTRLIGIVTIDWLPINTETGSERQVDLQSPAGAGVGSVGVRFSNVTDSGATTLNVITDTTSLPPPPVNFKVVESQDGTDPEGGTSLAYYELHTDATYEQGRNADGSGRVTVTIFFNALRVLDPNSLHLFHFEDPDGANGPLAPQWREGSRREISINVMNPELSFIRDSFPSLSPFALFALEPGEVTATLVGGLLQLVGSSHDDDLELRLDQVGGTTVVVAPAGATQLNGGVEPLTFVNVTAIDLQLLDGNDRAVTSGSVFVGPLTLSGGGGNDTLMGGAGPDRLSGDDGADMLQGGAGNDQLLGGMGNDVLSGEAGSDTLNGEAGADILREAADFNLTVTNGSLLMTKAGTTPTTDTLSGIELLDLTGGVSRNRIDAGGFVTANGPVHTLIGGGGIDTIMGTNGRDRITTFSSGTDSINGLGGNDTIFSGNGNDTIDGGAGNDWILSQNGDDSILGSDGSDMLFGNFGNDTLDGGAGTDRLFGLQDHDVLRGGTDNDSLFGDAGNDSLNGGAGNDLLRGSIGTDDFEGGAGAFDRVDEAGNTDFTVIGLQISSPLFGTEIARNIERFDLAGGPAANRIDASQSTVMVILNGLGGNDSLDGGAAGDLIFGGDGDDLLIGGPGNDSLVGEASNDTLNGNVGDDSLRGLAGNDSLAGGDGQDIITGGDDNDSLDGGVGNDGLAGRAGNDSIIGFDGNDTILGGVGNDTLLGAAQNDIVLGDAGDDRVDGQGASFDTVAGNVGADTVVGSASEVDETFMLSPALLGVLDTD